MGKTFALVSKKIARQMMLSGLLEAETLARWICESYMLVTVL
jgi:hypothetical protein